MAIKKDKGKEGKGRKAEGGRVISRDKAGSPAEPEGLKLADKKSLFKIWLALPTQFLGMPEDIAERLGASRYESEVLELMAIKTQKQFAEKYGLHENTLVKWSKEMHNDPEVRKFERFLWSLTKNVVGALYRKIMVEADAPRVKLWLQYVEGWKEEMGLSGLVGTYEMSPEEKKEWDALIAKNAK